MQFELQRRTIKQQATNNILSSLILNQNQKAVLSYTILVTCNNLFIIAMNSKYNQTDRWVHQVAFGNTVRIPLNRISIKPRKSSSKSKPKEGCGWRSKPHVNLLSNTVSSKKGGQVANSLKTSYDSLMNELFLKIDFDCTGFITFTKISYCKEIPEAVFYFLGGVFQKVKQLGAITLKTFEKLCEEAFIQAKIEDIESILTDGHQTVRKNKEIEHTTTNLRSQKKIRDKTEPDQSRHSCETGRQFSTKKISKSLRLQPKYSLKLKTQPSQKMQKLFQSQVKLKPVQGLKLNGLDLSYRQTSPSQDYNVSFQEEKVRVLTERLDHQISRNNRRFFTNKFIY